MLYEFEEIQGTAKFCSVTNKFAHVVTKFARDEM